MKLNLGCGKDIKQGYINLDIVDYGGNQIHDINSFPYPFADNTFGEVYASHVLEHLDSFHKTVTAYTHCTGSRSRDTKDINKCPC